MHDTEAVVRRCSVKKGVLKNFTKFTGKHLCQSLFFNKVAGLRPATLLKKRLWHRCFPVNFVKFLRTPFYIEHLWRLLLMIYGIILVTIPYCTIYYSLHQDFFSLYVPNRKVLLDFFIVSTIPYFNYSYCYHTVLFIFKLLLTVLDISEYINYYLSYHL